MTDDIAGRILAQHYHLAAAVARLQPDRTHLVLRGAEGEAGGTAIHDEIVDVGDLEQPYVLAESDVGLGAYVIGRSRRRPEFVMFAVPLGVGLLGPRLPRWGRRRAFPMELGGELWCAHCSLPGARLHALHFADGTTATPRSTRPRLWRRLESGTNTHSPR